MRVADATTLGPIQLIPQGMTGLLQIKQLGRSPGELSEVVSPVCELRDWYFASRTVTEQDLLGALPTLGLVTGNIGIQQFSTAKVPNNQRWYIFNATVFTQTAAAADVVSFGVGIVPASTGSFTLLGNPYVDVVTTRQRNMFSAGFNFWAGPGDNFAALIIDISTAGVTAQLRLRGVAMPI